MICFLAALRVVGRDFDTRNLGKLLEGAHALVAVTVPEVLLKNINKIVRLFKQLWRL